MPDAEPWQRIAYLLARHLRAVNRMPAGTWSLRGLQLLAELRALDPARCDRELSDARRPPSVER